MRSQSSTLTQPEMNATELAEHYKRVRERLGLRVNAPVITKKREPVLVATVPEDVAVKVVQTGNLFRYNRGKVATLFQQEVNRADVNARPVAKTKFHKLAFDLAELYGLPYMFFLASSRTTPYIKARAELYYKATAMGYSYMEIARKCKRDHTTVRHSALKHAKEHGLPLHIEKP